VFKASSTIPIYQFRLVVQNHPIRVQHKMYIILLASTQRKRTRGINEEDEQLAKGEAGRDAEVERGVQDRRPTRDARRSAARRWCRVVVRARTGTPRAIPVAVAALWDDKGRALSLAALNPFVGDAVLR
jgi:hypothetical protein